MPDHVHRWLVPTAPQAPGLYVAACACGASKELRPFDDEDGYGRHYGPSPEEKAGRRLAALAGQLAP